MAGTNPTASQRAAENLTQLRVCIAQLLCP
jgi:hypothetical protein